MAKNNKLNENKEVKFNKNYYNVENRVDTVAPSTSVSVSTGSPVVGASSEMFGVPYSRENPPVSLTFEDGARHVRDKVRVINNKEDDAKIYTSIITKKP